MLKHAPRHAVNKGSQDDIFIYLHSWKNNQQKCTYIFGKEVGRSAGTSELACHVKIKVVINSTGNLNGY